MRFDGGFSTGCRGNIEERMKKNKYRGVIPISDLTYNRLAECIRDISEERRITGHAVSVVSARSLSSRESIGDPERTDFPLIKGKEVMVEATFDGAKGQAFTDMPGDFNGTLEDVLRMEPSNNFRRAVFVSTLNAVLRSLEIIDRTVHCKDEEPERCAEQMVDYVGSRFPNPRIGFIGLQPAMVDHLGRHFPIRVTDLDSENVGKSKYGVFIEDVDKTAEVIDWCTVIFATGSTFVNNTHRTLLNGKPLVFYGVTGAGIAYLTDAHVYCHAH